MFLEVVVVGGGWQFYDENFFTFLMQKKREESFLHFRQRTTFLLRLLFLTRSRPPCHNKIQIYFRRIISKRKVTVTVAETRPLKSKEPAATPANESIAVRFKCKIPLPNSFLTL